MYRKEDANRMKFEDFYLPFGRIAKGAVAETNYYNVRQSYRTCTNYRVLYRCRGFGCIINYEKCESLQSKTAMKSIYEP